MLVDMVTSRQANLHRAMVDLLGVEASYRLPEEPLYVTTYRPVRRQDAEAIDVWLATLAVGQPLPLLPLPLDKTLLVPLDLGATYHAACLCRRLT